MTIATITAEEYATLRAICDKADACAKFLMAGRKGNFITAEEAKHPDYAACNNEMRGKVEQYDLLHATPETIYAYVGTPNRNGMGLDRTYGQTYPVQVWTGLPIGYATKGKSWRIHGSAWGTHMSMFYARINGREYQGRGFGEGICITLRETAASKRSRA